MTAPAGDDVLRRATRALREESERERPGAIHAWQGMHDWYAVSRDVRKAARRRRVALVVGLQMIATLVGVGAWAAVSGRLPPDPARPPHAASPRQSQLAGPHGRRDIPVIDVPPA